MQLNQQRQGFDAAEGMASEPCLDPSDAAIQMCSVNKATDRNAVAASGRTLSGGLCTGAFAGASEPCSAVSAT